MKIMGIDLAGKDDNPTGMCILNRDNKRDDYGRGGTPPGCEIYTLTVIPMKKYWKISRL